MKIYVIVTDEVYDFENFDHKPIAFTKRELAEKEMDAIREGVKEEFENDFDTFVDGKDGFEMYNDGCYSEGHYSATIYEIDLIG